MGDSPPSRNWLCTSLLGPCLLGMGAPKAIGTLWGTLRNHHIGPPVITRRQSVIPLFETADPFSQHCVTKQTTYPRILKPRILFLKVVKTTDPGSVVSAETADRMTLCTFLSSSVAASTNSNHLQRCYRIRIEDLRNAMRQLETKIEDGKKQLWTSTRRNTHT